MRCIRSSRAQGATEYLVLLAVVLVIALVSIALLGFFPGTASDSQITESKIYWQSASPITITEMAAQDYDGTGWATMLYFRLKNTGNYPIRITAMQGGGATITTMYCDTTCDGAIGYKNLSAYYYLGPGEEKIYSHSSFGTSYVGGNGVILSTDPFRLTGRAICNPSATSSAKGAVAVRNFGFSYTAYIDGQAVNKFEGGKDLLIKCQ